MLSSIRNSQLLAAVSIQTCKHQEKLAFEIYCWKLIRTKIACSAQMFRAQKPACVTKIFIRKLWPRSLFSISGTYFKEYFEYFYTTAMCQLQQYPHHWDTWTNKHSVPDVQSLMQNAQSYAHQKHKFFHPNTTSLHCYFCVWSECINYTELCGLRASCNTGEIMPSTTSNSHVNSRMFRFANWILFFFYAL